MSNALARKGRQLAKKLIAFQIAVAAVMALIFLLTGGKLAAKSAIVGGLIAIIPNIVFAASVFQHAGASASKKVMKGFYRGVKLKFGFTVVLLAAAFSLLAVPVFPLITSFVVVILIHGLAPVFFQHKN